MNPHARRASEIEGAFLAGAEANLNQARGRQLPGSKWTWTTRSEEGRLRGLMAAARQHDRETLRSMPKNKTRILTGTQPRWLFGRKRTSVAIASVLTPLEHYVSAEGQPPPIGLADLAAHVRELAGEADVPHLIGVCSPSGFTEDARSSGLEVPNVTLVLVEPREDDGWTITAASPNATAADGKLFDPEAVSRKLQRVREEIESRGADLLTGGLSASALADRLGLPKRLVASAFEQAASADSELKVSRQRGEVLLFRGAPAGVEDEDMTMMDRLRQLFSDEGDETKKINALAERRAKLVQRRDRIYSDLGQLEKREVELLKQGRENPSPSAKRRMASQINQLRDDMKRLNATAKMLGQQVEVISTHIHNLTLIQQGQTAKLPATEEITEDAVRAEEMLEQLGTDVELTSSLGAGVSDELVSDEELAILRELEGAPAESEGTKPASASQAPSTPTRPEPAPEKKEPRRREPEAD